MLLHRLTCLLALAIALPAAALATPAPVKVTFCIFDPLGTRGEAYNHARDQVLAARKWGVEMTLKAYTDERVAAEDFKAGQCDGVAMTTIRAREFSPFVGSVDAIGALTHAEQVRALEETLANPKMAPRLISGRYEVVGLAPMGPAYVLVRDRRINSVEAAAGKKVAVINTDKAQAKIVQKLGAQPVASDITNFAGKFNNHQVDIVVAPVVLYAPLELYRGIGSTGGIYRFPLGQVTATMLIHRDRFPPDFGQKCREYALTQLDKAFALVARAEKEIPEKHWLTLSPADEERYFKMMREARIQLTQEGIYDKTMMRLLKNVRCKHNPKNAECALTDE